MFQSCHHYICILQLRFAAFHLKIPASSYLHLFHIRYLTDFTQNTTYTNERTTMSRKSKTDLPKNKMFVDLPEDLLEKNLSST
jgi:hypothetical protein